MLGITTPAAASGPHTPGASTKRHNGLTRYAFSQSAPRLFWLASKPAASQLSHGPIKLCGKARLTKSPRLANLP